MNRLRELRQAKNLSQQRLAGYLNLSQASISKYEKGVAEPDIKTLVDMALYFGVSIDYLLENSDYRLTAETNVLQEDEMELLHIFRMLNGMQKQIAFAYLRGISEQFSNR